MKRKREAELGVKDEIDQSLVSVMPQVLTSLIAEYAQPINLEMILKLPLYRYHSHRYSIRGALPDVLVLWCPICGARVYPLKGTPITYYTREQLLRDEKMLIPAMSASDWQGWFFAKDMDQDCLATELVQTTENQVYILQAYYDDDSSMYTHKIREYTIHRTNVQAELETRSEIGD